MPGRAICAGQSRPWTQFPNIDKVSCSCTVAHREPHSHDRLHEPLRYLDAFSGSGRHDDRYMIQKRVPEHPRPDRAATHTLRRGGPQRGRRGRADPPDVGTRDPLHDRTGTTRDGPPPLAVPECGKIPIEGRQEVPAQHGVIAVDVSGDAAAHQDAPRQVGPERDAIVTRRSQPDHRAGVQTDRPGHEGPGVRDSDPVQPSHGDRNSRSTSLTRRGLPAARSKGTQTVRAREATASPSKSS